MCVKCSVTIFQTMEIVTGFRHTEECKLGLPLRVRIVVHGMAFTK